MKTPDRVQHVLNILYFPYMVVCLIFWTIRDKYVMAITKCSHVYIVVPKKRGRPSNMRKCIHCGDYKSHIR